MGTRPSSLRLALYATALLAVGCAAGDEDRRDDLGESPTDMGTIDEHPATPPPDLRPRPDLGGQLDAEIADPPGTVDLTAQGRLDWVHWGVSGERAVTRKQGVERRISDVRVIGSGDLHQYTDNHVRFSWSDGVPIARANETSTGIFILGTGNGFALTVPAETTARTLRVYLSGFLSDVEVTARMSDGTAVEFRDVVIGRASGPGIYRVYSFVYRSPNPGQTLEVVWRDVKDHAGGGNVTLQAATLE